MSDTKGLHHGIFYDDKGPLPMTKDPLREKNSPSARRRSYVAKLERVVCLAEIVVGCLNDFHGDASKCIHVRELAKAIMNLHGVSNDR